MNSRTHGSLVTWLLDKRHTLFVIVPAQAFYLAQARIMVRRSTAQTRPSTLLYIFWWIAWACRVVIECRSDRELCGYPKGCYGRVSTSLKNVFFRIEKWRYILCTWHIFNVSFFFETVFNVSLNDHRYTRPYRRQSLVVCLVSCHLLCRDSRHDQKFIVSWCALDMPKHCAIGGPNMAQIPTLITTKSV